MIKEVKKKICILSTYDELCGNASYTEALAKALSKKIDTTVIGLNTRILRSSYKKGIETYLNKLCEKLKEYDVVNIQCEAILFGSTASSMRKNFFKVAKSCKKLVVTMHRVETCSLKNTLFKLSLSFLLHPKKILSSIKESLSQIYWGGFYKKIISFLKKTNSSIIVHSKTDQETILYMGFQDVFDFPLSFFSQDQIELFKKSSSRETFCKKHGLDEKNTYLGIFGFISSYKGYDTALEALRILPKNYVLLIFGSQHPLTIKTNEQINPCIQKIISKTKKLKLEDRVKFISAIDNNSFIESLIYCDFNLLPYLEVGQGGSAIAALSLETHSNAIFSFNKTFIELAKYAPNSFKMFSMGNYYELAHAILTYDRTIYSNALNNYFNKYNIEKSIDLYISLFNEEKPPEIFPSADLREFKI